MCGTSVIVLLAFAPAFANSQLVSSAARPGLGLGLGYQPAQRARLPPAQATGFSPAFAPEFAPAFFAGGSKTSGGSFSAPRSSGFRPTGGGAPAPPPSASMSTQGMTPDQIAFLQRQAAERGGGGASYSPSPAPAPAGGGGVPAEFAGMTPDQIEFMRRKKGEIGMTGGLDTHGRPRLLDAKQTAGDTTFMLAAAVLLSGVAFGVLRFRRVTSKESNEPLLPVSVQ